MNVALTTLSNHLYEDSRTKLCDSAKKIGIFNVNPYEFDDILSTEFYLQNQKILNNKKFLGFWLWKPYIILQELKKLDDGDVLIYADAGIEIIDSLIEIINICAISEPIMLFGNGSDSNSAWVKRDCFVLMNCDSDAYWYSPHCDASLSLYRKSDSSIKFLEDWLKYCCNESIITNKENICGLPNLPDYKDHRYDQSVLSLLAQKYKLKLYRMPSQFGNHFKMHPGRIEGEFNCLNQSNQTQVNYYSNIPYYNSSYGQLVNHHRTKNKDASVNIDKNNIMPNKLNYISLVNKIKLFLK